MKQSLSAVVLVCAAALSACAESGTPPTACPAPDLQSLIGQPAEAAASVPDPKRVYGPGAALTMDYREERTNVETDAAGVIVAVTCG